MWVWQWLGIRKHTFRRFWRWALMYREPKSHRELSAVEYSVARDLGLTDREYLRMKGEG